MFDVRDYYLALCFQVIQLFAFDLCFIAVSVTSVLILLGEANATDGAAIQ